MSKLVKILIIFPMDPFGDKIGGTGTFLRNFIKYAPDYFDIDLVGISRDRKATSVGKWHSVKIGNKKLKFLPILCVPEENVRSIVPLSFKFTIALFMNKSKISLENKILDFHRVEPSIAFKKAHNKKILFVHGDVRDLYNLHSEMKWSKFPWLYFKAEKMLITRMDRVFVVREDAVNFYKKCYPSIAGKFSFIPTFVDRKTFYPYSDSKKKKQKSYFLNTKNLPVDSKLILFVGRLEGAKDPLLLIDTFSYINKSYPGTVLLVIGDGALKKKMIAKIKQHELDGRVYFFGVLPQGKVAEFMRISDVFVLTSAFEGMPISVLESLASGLPVVSTNVGEVKRVIKDGVSGFVSPERKTNILGNLVLKVFRENKRFNINNCVESIREYTAERVLAKIYKIHHDLRN